MVKKVWVLLGVCLLIFSSCSIGEDPPNFTFVPLRTESAEFPPSFRFGETYNIPVTFALPDGCHFFEGFDIAAEDTYTRIIIPVGSRVENTQTACTQAVQIRTVSFEFSVYYTETYTFKFWTGEDSSGNATYLEYEVFVEQ